MFELNLTRKKTLISFSGGRTSALMTRILIEEKAPNQDIVVIFANTGQEHEKTLEFVNKCDKSFAFNVVWVEAVVSEARGVGTSFKVVDFDSASRDGGPFEAFIKKYGIPNRNFPQCTRETKLRPITAYARSIGWCAKTYDTAIGIRSDEIDRVNPKHKDERIIYPLIDMEITKEDVIAFWKSQPFDLEIPEHYGNCVWCWKKSLRKHLTIIREHPEFMDFPRRMMEMYPDAGPGVMDRPRRFFRGSLTVEDLENKAQSDFNVFVDKNHNYELDAQGSCGESCEVFNADDIDSQDEL